MIYILINNQYHIYDYDQWIEDFKNEKISLIQIPHSLIPVNQDDRFTNIYTYNRFVKNVFSLLYFKKIFKIHNKIRKEIFPNENDILLVYTEYEILNQFIIKIFHEAKSKILLLEDGLATMTLCNSDFKTGNIKSRIYEFILKKIYGYKSLKIYDLPDPTPLMNDYLFNGVCVRLGISINRNIPLFNFSSNKNQKIEDLNYDKAIFINNDLYNFFCTYEDYIEILENTLKLISTQFTEIYFKFHPRESKDYIVKISSKIQQIPNIKILKTDEIIENQVLSIKPKFAFSFVSAALINLFHKGIIPVFLYETDYRLSNDKFVREIRNFLHSINYKPINNVTKFDKSYDCGLEDNNENVKTLYEIIKLN